jgi:ribosomal protein S9
MRALVGPRTARHARLLRLAHQLEKQGIAGVPKSEGEKMVWVNSHIRKDDDQRLSKLEESLREKQMPLGVGENAVVAHGQASQGNLFQFREFPMYPGEYIPPQHNTLSSLRDELRMDLTAQSIKEAWLRVSGGFVSSVDEYYAQVDGLDVTQLTEIVSAVQPQLSKHQARALTNKVLESIAKPADNLTRRLSRTITAEAVGLDNAPQHYTNFMEWMSRISETKAFRTEHALFQFSRRKFNRSDVRVMFENYNSMSAATLQQDSADSYSHFYTILKDFAVKVAGQDTRHQLGVRIDAAEVDVETGTAVGHGRADGFRYIFTAIIRENRDHNGSVTLQGKPLHVAFDNQSWLMEQVLMPFDEAKLDARDYDVSIINEGTAEPFIGNEISASACRLAVAQSISKLMPLTRIPLKKAGLLSFDKRYKLGQSPKFVDGQRARRMFRKR